MTVATFPYIHDGGNTGGPEFWATRLGSTTPEGQIGRYAAGGRTYLGTYGNYGSSPGGASGPGGVWGMCAVGNQIWVTLPESSSGPGPAIMRINRDGSSAGSNITTGTLAYPRGICFDGTNVWVADRGTLGQSIGGIWHPGSGGHLAAFSTSGTWLGDFGLPTVGIGGTIQHMWETYAVAYSPFTNHIWALTLHTGSLGVGTQAVVFDTSGTILGSNGSANSSQTMIVVNNNGTGVLWNNGSAHLQIWSEASVLLYSVAGSYPGPMVQVELVGGSEVWMVNGTTINRFAVSGTFLGTITISGVPFQTETDQAFVFPN